MNFTGVTEYLGKINKIKTVMLMHGEKFSIIPLTTHINLKKIYKKLDIKILKTQISTILNLIKNKKYCLKFKNIKLTML